MLLYFNVTYVLILCFSEGSSTAAVVGRWFGRGKSSLYAGSVASRIIVLVEVSTLLYFQKYLHCMSCIGINLEQ